MITKFSQYHKIQEDTNDPNSFEKMMKVPSKMFFDDVQDQILRYADRIVAKSENGNLLFPASFFMVFEYKNHLFKMDFTTGGISVNCYYVKTPPSGKYQHNTKLGFTQTKNGITTGRLEGDDYEYISIGSMSQSVAILINKIDKFIRNAF